MKTETEPTAKQETHSPLPWRYDGEAITDANDACVAMEATDCGDHITEANAELIVRAVNEHAALCKVAEAAVVLLSRHQKTMEDFSATHGPSGREDVELVESALSTLAALRK